MFKVNILSSITFFLIGLSSSQVYAQSLDAPNSSPKFSKIETVVDGLLNPYAIAIDDKDLIVTVNGALVKIDDSGNITTLTTLTPGVPSGAIVFGSDYIVIDPAQPPTPTSLLRVSQVGDVTEIAEIAGDPAGLAVQNSDFIVADFNRVNNNPFVGNGRLLRISENGSSISIIASEGLGGALDVFVDGENFWVTDFTFGRLLFVSSNGDVTEIATGLGQPLDIEFNGRDFIITDFADGFNDPGNGRILRVTKSGEVDTLVSGIGNPSGLAIQGSDLLFTDLVAGRIGRISGLLAAESVPEPSSVLGLLALSAFGAVALLKRRLKQSTEATTSRDAS